MGRAAAFRRHRHRQLGPHGPLLRATQDNGLWASPNDGVDWPQAVGAKGSTSRPSTTPPPTIRPSLAGPSAATPSSCSSRTRTGRSTTRTRGRARRRARPPATRCRSSRASGFSSRRPRRRPSTPSTSAWTTATPGTRSRAPRSPRASVPACRASGAGASPAPSRRRPCTSRSRARTTPPGSRRSPASAAAARRPWRTPTTPWSTSGFAHVGTAQPVWNVDRHDPSRLYAFDAGAGKVKFSSDGGTTWPTDAPLSSLVSGNGQFLLAPHSTAGFGFNENRQVTAFGFDDQDGRRILTGTEANGVFASFDRGASWAHVQGSELIPVITSFFFDQRVADVYFSSYSRGLWKMGWCSAGGADTTPPTFTFVPPDITTESCGAVNIGTASRGRRLRRRRRHRHQQRAGAVHARNDGRHLDRARRDRQHRHRDAAGDACARRRSGLLPGRDEHHPRHVEQRHAERDATMRLHPRARRAGHDQRQRRQRLHLRRRRRRHASTAAAATTSSSADRARTHHGRHRRRQPVRRRRRRPAERRHRQRHAARAGRGRTRCSARTTTTRCSATTADKLDGGNGNDNLAAARATTPAPAAPARTPSALRGAGPQLVRRRRPERHRDGPRLRRRLRDEMRQRPGVRQRQRLRERPLLGGGLPAVRRPGRELRGIRPGLAPDHDRLRRRLLRGAADHQQRGGADDELERGRQPDTDRRPTRPGTAASRARPATSPSRRRPAFNQAVPPGATDASVGFCATGTTRTAACFRSSSARRVATSAVRSLPAVHAPGARRSCAERDRAARDWATGGRQRRRTSLSQLKFGGERRGLNPQHPEPQSGALPIELRPPYSVFLSRARQDSNLRHPA